MKRKPLEKAEFYVCVTCGTLPGLILTDEKTFFPSYPHFLSLHIDDESIQVESEDGMSLSMIEEKYRDKISNCKFAELYHETPLHDETWELNKDDGKWYLVDQGQGYA